MKILLLISVVIYLANAAVDEHRMAKLEQQVQDLTRQLMLTELAMGERARAEADSGIKQVRSTTDATKSYYAPTHTYNSVCSIHEHSNYDRTVGMGEFIASLNGVDFRTRHNDYKLRMPSTTTKSFNALSDIPFPAVPPSVLQKRTVQEQIHEMQNYFRAFAFQNHHFRDYRPYFKPVLCYLEGTWTTNTKTLNEPFESDRHHIDAENWFDLQEKIRFTSYTGGKHYLENFSYLPTTIMNMVNGTPEYAQWNYRIACHPLKEDLPLSTLKPVDDLAARIGHRMNLTRFSHTRAARFTFAKTVNARRNHYKWQDGYGEWSDGSYHNGILDKIMREIPGKDNYGSVLNDNTFGMETLDATKQNNTLLNTANYHRLFKHDKKGAMGVKTVHRGYADRNLFVAQTTNPAVAPFKIHYCARDEHTHHKFCKTEAVRYSYAIPMEIIYMTPLYSWNPYNLELIPRTDRRGQGKITEAGKRNGGLTADKAYNGTSFKYYYRTPVEFFHGTNVDKDRADTDKGAVGVLDRHGSVKKVVASGTRITLPDIPGVGKLRIRYPVMPVTREGNQVGKEVDAIKEVLNHLESMGSYLDEKPSSLSGGSANADAHFRTSVTNQDPPGHHFHELYIDHEDMTDLQNGITVTVDTTTDNSHFHKLDITYDKATNKFVIKKCDGADHCFDGHTNELSSLD